MRVTAIMIAVVGLAVSLVPQATARSVLVDRVSSALQESFDSLNSKRNGWLENYKTINNQTKTSTAQLKELLMVSKMALPLMWQLYATTVKAQKKHYPKVIDAGPQSLPFHVRASFAEFKYGSSFYLQASLLIQQRRDFQVQILKDDEAAVFFLNYNFDGRRAVMGHSDQNQHIQEVVLTDDQFPEIALHQPFWVNVQVMQDCIVASIWLTNLDLSQPMPLPNKHIWCTRDYSLASSYSISIHALDGHLRSSPEDENHQHSGSQEGEDDQVSNEGKEQDHEEENANQEGEEENSSQEGHEEESSDIKLVSAVVYAGFIHQ